MLLGILPSKSHCYPGMTHFYTCKLFLSDIINMSMYTCIYLSLGLWWFWSSHVLFSEKHTPVGTVQEIPDPKKHVWVNDVPFSKDEKWSTIFCSLAVGVKNQTSTPSISRRFKKKYNQHVHRDNKNTSIPSESLPSMFFTECSYNLHRTHFLYPPKENPPKEFGVVYGPNLQGSLNETNPNMHYFLRKSVKIAIELGIDPLIPPKWVPNWGKKTITTVDGWNPANHQGWWLSHYW